MTMMTTSARLEGPSVARLAAAWATMAHKVVGHGEERCLVGHVPSALRWCGASGWAPVWLQRTGARSPRVLWRSGEYMRDVYFCGARGVG